jgi:hypothetical protein
MIRWRRRRGSNWCCKNKPPGQRFARFEEVLSWLCFIFRREAHHRDRVIGMRGLRHSQGARRSGDALPFFRGSFGRRSSFERTPSFQRQDSSSVYLSVQTVLRGFVVQKRGAAALRHPSVLPPPDIYESLTTDG